MMEKGQTVVGVGGWLLLVLGIIVLIVGVAGLFNTGPLERNKLTSDEVLTIYPDIEVPTTATAVLTLVNGTQENVEAQISIVATIIGTLIILLGVGFVALAGVLSAIMKIIS